jgi:hypothetical protein
MFGSIPTVNENYTSRMMRELDAAADKYVGRQPLSRVGLSASRVRELMMEMQISQRTKERAKQESDFGAEDTILRYILGELKKGKEVPAIDLARAVGCGGRRINSFIWRLRDAGHQIIISKNRNGAQRIQVSYKYKGGPKDFSNTVNDQIPHPHNT